MKEKLSYRVVAMRQDKEGGRHQKIWTLRVRERPAPMNRSGPFLLYAFSVDSFSMVNHMRHNRGQTGSRRSHHSLAKTASSICPNCGAVKLPHRICQVCGKYKGREVVDMIAISAKKTAKAKARKEGGVDNK